MVLYCHRQASIFENITKKKCNINWGGKQYRKTDVMNAVADLNVLNKLNWYSKIDLRRGINLYIKSKLK
mgnify:CR=1 FL=1